jgi:hypothetical protein
VKELQDFPFNLWNFFFSYFCIISSSQLR